MQVVIVEVQETKSIFQHIVDGQKHSSIEVAHMELQEFCE